MPVEMRCAIAGLLTTCLMRELGRTDIEVLFYSLRTPGKKKGGNRYGATFPHPKFFGLSTVRL
jgi:hypothetical protein